MKLRKPLLAVLLTGILTAANAQTISKEKVVGVWSLVSMKQDTITFNFTSEEEFKKSVFEIRRRLKSDTVFTAADSSIARSIIKELFTPFSNFKIELRKNNTYVVFTAYEGEAHREKGRYKLKGNEIYLGRNSLPVLIRDDNTIEMRELAYSLFFAKK